MTRSNFLNLNIILSLKIAFILENSVDPDEIFHYVTFHLGLHSLPNYLFIGIQYEKG